MEQSKYQWDLTEMVESLSAFSHTYDEIQKQMKEAASFRGHILDSSETFFQFLDQWELITRKSEHLFIYANLKHELDMRDIANQQLLERATLLQQEVQECLGFAFSEILEAGSEKVFQYVEEDTRLEVYRFYLKELFSQNEHILPKEQETLLYQVLGVFGTGADVYHQLYDIDVDYGTILDDHQQAVVLTNHNYRYYLSSVSERVRRETYEAVYGYWKHHRNSVVAALKGYMKEQRFLAQVQQYETPLQMSLYPDHVDTDVFHRLIAITRKNIPLLKRYLSMKKHILKMDSMHPYDLSVVSVSDFVQSFSYEEAIEIVTNALEPLGKRYQNDLKQAFSDGWIDVYAKPGRYTGSYQWSSYDSKPYLLVNYDGSVQSVSTLAHELGHAMHTYYAKKQDYLYATYPNFLIEMAPLVNEILIYHYLIEQAKTKKEKQYYLLELLEMIRTTVYRQVLFAEFEWKLYETMEAGNSLFESDVSDLYYHLIQEYYGEEIAESADDLIRYEWMLNTYFFRSFYTSSYAIGFICALAVASELVKGTEGVKESYVEFLESGSSDYPISLLRKMGIDLSTDEAFQKAFDYFQQVQDELEQLSIEKEVK